ncbi:hypothetical protein HDV05_005320, partial [Chytridiales sp. JEL 0842]
MADASIPVDAGPTPPEETRAQTPIANSDRDDEVKVQADGDPDVAADPEHDDDDFDVEEAIRLELEALDRREKNGELQESNDTASDDSYDSDSQSGEDEEGGYRIATTTSRPTSSGIERHSTSWMKAQNEPTQEPEDQESNLEKMPSWTSFIQTLQARDSEIQTQTKRVVEDAERAMESLGARRSVVRSDVAVNERQDGVGQLEVATIESQMMDHGKLEDIADVDSSRERTRDGKNNGLMSLIESRIGTRAADESALPDPEDDDEMFATELAKEMSALKKKLKDIETTQATETSLLNTLQSAAQTIPTSLSASRPPKKRMKRPKLRRGSMDSTKRSMEGLSDWGSDSSLGESAGKWSASMGDVRGGVLETPKGMIHGGAMSASVIPHGGTAGQSSKHQEGSGGSVVAGLGAPVGPTTNDLNEEELIAYKKEERAHKIEYQSLQMSITQETEKQAQLTFRLESIQSSMALQRRAVHATKMKARELQEKARQLVHWHQVVARVAFDKEKDKTNTLLMRATKVFNHLKVVQDKTVIRVNELTQSIQESNNRFQIIETESMQLRLQEQYLADEVERLKAIYERELEVFKAKRDAQEMELLTRIQAEEAVKVFEQSLLTEACGKQGQGKAVDVEDLETFEANGKGLARIPNVKQAVKLRFIDFSGNTLSSLRGLEHLKSLQSLTLDNNKFTNIDLLNFNAMRFLSAANNTISKLEGFKSLPDLVYINLSGNPISQLDEGKNETVQIFILHDTLIQDLSSIEGLSSLIYLDVSKTKIGAHRLDPLHAAHILQFLDLSMNKYEEVPAIPNPLLHVLRMEDNLIRMVEMNTWLPRLRVLDLSNNKIQSIEPLCMCPFLVELYLANNLIQEQKSLYSIAVCQDLQVLDLSKNPIAHTGKFYTTCASLMVNLEMLNRVPVNFKRITKNVPRASAVVWACRMCLTYFTQYTLTETEEKQVLMENFEDYKKSVSAQQSSIESFMGTEYQPYLTYLSKDRNSIVQETAVRQRILEHRLNWLAGLLNQNLVEMTDLDKHFKPSRTGFSFRFLESALAGVSFVEHLEQRVFVFSVVTIQSLWRRKMARRLAYKRMKAILMIQRWYVDAVSQFRTQKKVKVDKRKAILNKSATKIQALWRGKSSRYHLRKQIHSIQIEEDLDLKELEDTSLNDWLSQTRENAFDEDLQAYLTEPHLPTTRPTSNAAQHSKAEYVLGRESKQTPVVGRKSFLMGTNDEEGGEVQLEVFRENMEGRWLTKH